jgi:hypothetical protein
MAQWKMANGAQIRIVATPNSLQYNSRAGGVEVELKNRSIISFTLKLNRCKSTYPNVADHQPIGQKSATFFLPGRKKNQRLLATPTSMNYPIAEWIPKSPGYSTLDAEFELHSSIFLAHVVPTDEVEVL